MAKKGQAAIEFLMTYGWAILAAIVVIGVLAYFGVFSPASYVPNQCILSAPLGCNAGIASPTGVQLEVRNGAGESLDITAITVSGCTGTVTGTGTLADQGLATIGIGCTLTAGEKFNGNVVITYRKAGSGLDLTSTGKLVDSI